MNATDLEAAAQFARDLMTMLTLTLIRFVDRKKRPRAGE
jgi:hypothetical protein